MRHRDGDKIVIARNDTSGAWVYFSVRDDRDNGTIIDFLQNTGAAAPWAKQKRPCGLAGGVQAPT